MSYDLEDWSPPPDDYVTNSGDASGSVLASPGAGTVVDDWGFNLGTVTDFVGGIAKSASTIIGARDALVDRNNQRQYDQAMKASQLSLARAQLDAGSTIAKLDLQGQVLKAQQALQRITTGQPGGWFMIALVAGGVYLLVKKG